MMTVSLYLSLLHFITSKIEHNSPSFKSGRPGQKWAPHIVCTTYFGTLRQGKIRNSQAQIVYADDLERTY
uniref:Uncharacterized protein n=1 Tax=Lepeophtheirus salmonis TaxID=72036 RepID=A0A0K2VKC0_LEPSM